MNSLSSRFLWLAVLSLACLGAPAVRAADYTITVGVSSATVVDSSGNADALFMETVAANTVRFRCTGRTFSVNGAAATTNTSDNFNISTLSSINVDLSNGNDTFTITNVRCPSVSVDDDGAFDGTDEVVLAGQVDIINSHEVTIEAERVSFSAGLDLFAGSGRIGLSTDEVVINPSVTITDGGEFSIDTLTLGRDLLLGGENVASTSLGSTELTVLGAFQQVSFGLDLFSNGPGNAGAAVVNGSVAWSAAAFVPSTVQFACPTSLAGSLEFTSPVASGDVMVFDQPVTLTGAMELKNPGTLRTTLKAVNLGAHNLTLSTPTAITGVISGTGGLVVNQSTTASGANTFSGPITVNASTFTASNAAATGTSAGGVLVQAGGSFALGADLSASTEVLTLNGGTLRLGTTGTAFTFGGPVSLTANSTVTVGAARVLTVTGAISGNFGLTMTGGTGTLVLSGANLFTGAVAVNEGRVLVNGSTVVSASHTVNTGGTLAGGGTVAGTVLVSNGGTLSAGTAGSGVSTAVLTTGSLTLSAGSSLSLEFTGTTLGTQHDQVQVTGSVDVTGATLTLGGGYVPNSSTPFTILLNDGADAVVGTFAGLADGATASLNGTSARISYVGGDGNDITLTPILPTMILQGNSITIANGDTTPDAADHTEFGSVASAGGVLTRTFTILNTGLGSLGLTGVPLVAVSGAQASDFSVTTLPVTPVAAVNGSTTFVVRFAPRAAGLRVATISIPNSDAGKNPYTFAVQGTGLAASPLGVVRLDASTLAQASGTTVATWGGQTASDTPTYLTNQTPAGGPAVEFNGADRMGENVNVLPSEAQDWIYALVIKPVNTGAYQNLADDDPSARPMLWIDGSFRYEFNYGGTTRPTAGTGPGGWDIVIVDSRLNKLYVNTGAAPVDGGGAVSYAAAKAFDFFHRDGGDSFRGLVAEARVYSDRASFGGDFIALHNELYAKWIGALPVTAPVVSTPTSTNIGLTTATLGGTVVYNGEVAITARGVVYAKTAENANPQIGGANVTVVNHATNATGVFTVDAAGLTAGTGYSFAAFATNSVGTTYTSPASTFTTAQNAPEIAIEDPSSNNLVASTVVAWGSNNYGQTTLPAGLTGVVDVAMGGRHSLALKADGSVVAWGNNDRGQCTIPTQATSGVTAISAGGDHSLALKTDGTVIAWGSNDFGECDVPVGLTGVVAVSAGGFGPLGFSVALKSDGTVRGWGYNGDGQRTVPVGLNNVTAISAGSNRVMVLKAEGTPLRWGDTTLFIPSFAQSNLLAVSAGGVGDAYILASDNTGFYSNGTVSYDTNPVTAVSAIANNVIMLKANGTMSASIASGGGFASTTAAFTRIRKIGKGGMASHGLAIQTSTVALGTQKRGTSGTARTFTIRNPGFQPLSIGGVSTIAGTHGSDFVIDTTGMLSSVPAGGQTTFTVSFSPTAAGARQTFLRVTNGDSDEGVFEIDLTGTGIDPDIQVQGNSLTIADTDIIPSSADHTDFGSVATSLTRTFTIQNTGSASLVLPAGAITLSGTHATDYTVGGITLPASIDAAGNTTFTVTLVPGGSGLRTATVNIASDDPDAENPYTFAVQGTGSNSAPTAIQLSSTTLAENTGANAVIGTLSSTDLNAGDTHTYSLVTGAGDTHNVAFNLSGNSLRLTASADFETLSTYSVRVQSNDGNGGTYEEAFAITITNVNELPSFTKGVDQTHVSGTNTAQSISNWATAINDGDSTVEQTLSFNVSNSNNALFTTQPAISSTGTLTYTPTGTAGTATVSVSITDDNSINGNAALTSAVQTFTITVASLADYSVVVTATEITVTDLSGNGNALTLQQQPGDTIRFFDVGRTFSVNGGLPNTTRPASDISLAGITSITVNAGEGDDSIGVQAFTTAMPSLTIHGGNGSDSLVASGDVTFAANASVVFDGGDESNTASTAGNITFQSGVEWVLSGTGGATLRCGRAFSMSSGARLVAVNGDLLVEANQQATPREGSFAGITLTGNATANSVVLGTSGTGNVTLRGRSAELAGISCTFGASVTGGTAGTVTVIGECRSTLANGSHGVVFSTSSQVSTTGANIDIRGTSGLGGGNFGSGFSMTSSSSVTAGGTGTISITGTGRGTAGSFRRGVEIGTSNVAAAMALVSTANGDIAILGTSGDGTSGSNYGVQVYFANVQAGGGGNVSITGTSNGTAGNFNSGITMSSSPLITATGTGDVSLNGTSGTSPGDGMIGVVLPPTVGTPISTQNGDIAITSINRGTGAGTSSDHALTVAGGVNVTTTGSGSITLTGNASSVQAWDGVRIVGRVATGGGSVTLNGTGGGIGIQVAGGVVEGPAAGSTLTVNGTGGSVATSYTHGFQTSSSAQLTTTGGNVVIRSFGGTGGTLESVGINLFGSSQISAGGDGSITLEGTAGNGVAQTTIPLIGTWLRTGGLVQTNNGSITIKGTTNNLSSNVNCAGINGSSGSSVTAGGVGNLELQADSMIFAGSMTATGDTIRARPLTVGTTMKLGAADNRGSSPLVLGLTDAELDTLSAATLKLGDADTGGLTLEAAVSRAASTNLELDAGTGGIVFNTGGINSGGGTIWLKGTLATQPISSGTDVTASTVTVQSALTFAIDGVTVDTQYRQLKAVGAVVLSGTTLTLTGAHVPALGNSFTLIDNDGTDAVTGTFTGLAEGASITFNGIPLRLSYVGGTGNDVVLTLLNQAPTLVALSNSAVAENGAANALIGTLSTTDANNADTHTYTFVAGANDNAAFSLSGNELRLIASADFETKSTYSLRVLSTDNGTPAFSVEQALTVTVLNVNEMPSFAAGGNQLHVFGTSTVQSVTAWATGINDGDSTVTQSLSFNVSNNNNTLFTTQPAVAANGTLSYTPNGTAGSATISVSLTDDASINSNAALTTGVQTFLITIGENTAPTISTIAAQSTLEDTTSSAIAFTVGDSEQTLTSLNVTAASTNIALIPVVNIALGGSGANRTATITPVANLSGSSQITLTVSDGLLTAQSIFTFTVTAVNDLPSFTKGANQTHLFGTNTAQSVESWATVISDGDSAEEQTLSFNVTNNNNGLFTTQPTISSTGTLTYKPRGTAGTATVSVSITDDNTISGNAALTSAVQTFTITVGANTAPTISAVTAQSTLEDTVSSAISFTVGDGETAAADLTVTAASSNTTLVPVVNIAHGGSGSSRNVVITPATDLNGTSNITLTVSDGTTTASTVFTLTVTPVNDAPSFTPGIDETRTETIAAAAYTITNWATVLSKGPANESTQTLQFVITGNSNASLFSVAPAISSTGTLTYTVAGLAYGTAAITYKLRDSGGTDNGGMNESKEFTLNITVGEVNHPPSVIGSGVPNQTLGNGTAPLNLDLFSYFTDLDVQDALGFSIVTNTAPDRATAAIVGSTLTLTPLSTGVTSITVSCIDDGQPARSVEQTFTITVGSATLSLTVDSNARLNRTTGLLESRVRITNTLGRVVEGFRIQVTNLPAKYQLWNRTHATLPVIELNQTLPSGGVVTVMLEFYSPTRSFGSYRPAFTVLETAGNKPLEGTGGTPALRALVLPDSSVLVQFAAVISRSYVVEYSDDAGRSWRISPVGIKAGATRIQWVDRGPPYTHIAPALPLVRQYRMRLVP